MAIKVQSSFAAGEIDPALHERTDLQKYQTGLAAARNVYISKTGRIISRSGRYLLGPAKDSTPGNPVVVFCPPASGMITEWGVGYVRVTNIVTGFLGDVVTTYRAEDIPFLQFETSGNYIYVFLRGSSVNKFNFNDPLAAGFVTGSSIFALPPSPVSVSLSIGGTGYQVDYAVTLVINGEESPPLILAPNAAYKLPITAGTQNVLDMTVGATTLAGLTECRIYRRPTIAGAFGFIGSGTAFTISGGNFHCAFNDLGAAADYTHSPPTLEPQPSTPGPQVPPYFMDSPTGIIYQQRLLITEGQTGADFEAIHASRPGYQNDFYRDYPLSSDSALSFKTGTSGTAQVLRMLDNNGLVVFTTIGVFLNQGALDLNNLAFAKKGAWVIQSNIPPLAMPGGTIFMDSATNSVRQIIWSNELQNYVANELSIYSSHLFTKRGVVAWAFEQNDTPLLWVVYDDGTFASLNFDPTQQMQSWTRHDSVGKVEYVASTGFPGRTVWVTNINGQRCIEVTISKFRKIPAGSPFDAADHSDQNAAMDCTIDYEDAVNQYLIDQTMTLTPVVANVWDGQLTLHTGTANVFALTCVFTVTSANATVGSTYTVNGHTFTTMFTIASQTTVLMSGVLPPGVTSGTLTKTSGTGDATIAFSVVAISGDQVGDVFRFFDEDGSSVDLTIVSKTNNNTIVVQTSCLFPSDQASGDSSDTGLVLFRTKNVITGLDVLNGEKVSVLVDGAVVASPNNDIENYPVLTVSGGSITLPNGMRGAIVHVGLPFTADVETLDIDTVNQQPVLVESKTVNKVYVKVYNTRGLYAGNSLPASGGVSGMEDLDDIDVDYSQAEPIIGNMAEKPTTRRVEVSLAGDWSQQGKVCLRQVDPLHFEILSIIPDIDVEQRGR